MVNNTTTRERDYRIDQLRAITFFFVILGHTPLIIPEWGAYSHAFIILIYSFHMPLFFFLSGMTFNRERAMSQPYFKSVAGYAKRLMLPYFWLSLIFLPVWALVYVAIGGSSVPLYLPFVGIFIANPAHTLTPATALWFLPALFLALSLYTLIIRLVGRRRWLTPIILILLELVPYFTRCIHLPWHINVIPTAMIFLYLGTLFTRYKNTPVLSWLFGSRVVNIIIAVADLLLWAALSLVNGKVSMYANDQQNPFLFYLCAALGIFWVMYFVYLLPKFRFLCYVGQNTMFYLAAHIQLIFIVKTILPDLCKIPWFLLILAVVLFIIIAPVCMLINKTAPYVVGSRRAPTRLIRALHYSTVFTAIITPMILLFDLISPGCLNNFIIIALLVAICAAISIGLTQIFRKYCPVVFGEEKEKKHDVQ